MKKIFATITYFQFYSFIKFIIGDKRLSSDYFLDFQEPDCDEKTRGTNQK